MTVTLSIPVSSRIRNNISHTFQCRGHQSGLSVLLNGRVHKQFSHNQWKNANFDVPLLFLLLSFKQHMIPTATISVTPTAAMTPMMMTKTEIRQQCKLVTFKVPS